MKLPKRNTISDNKSINLNKKYIQGKSPKPKGIWYSCFNNWYNWIVREMPEWMRNYIHKIKINKNILTDITNKDKNKLLVIKNDEDFDAFNKNYKIDVSKTLPFIESTPFPGAPKIIMDIIDWKKVAEDFGGIEICPFLINKQNYYWYFQWDVASGCIWNASTIIDETEIIYKKTKNTYKKV